MQLSRNKLPQPEPTAHPALRRLTDLREGEHAILERLELPEDFARRLMELGFLPGSRITAARSAPGGDPRVYQVDGSEIALRAETASRLRIRPSRDAS
jgi:Fe2+ transport system protein FeoA